MRELERSYTSKARKVSLTRLTVRTKVAPSVEEGTRAVGEAPQPEAQELEDGPLSQRDTSGEDDSRNTTLPVAEDTADDKVASYFDDFGLVYTTAIKAKDWCTYVWRGLLLLCVTGTFAVMETTNLLLMVVCGCAGMSVVSVEA